MRGVRMTRSPHLTLFSWLIRRTSTGVMSAGKCDSFSRASSWAAALARREAATGEMAFKAGEAAGVGGEVREGLVERVAAAVGDRSRGAGCCCALSTPTLAGCMFGVVPTMLPLISFTTMLSEGREE